MLIYLNGLMLGLSLIMALGPQNIFLIKQGAKKNHPLLSAAICFLCDVILIGASVTGLHRVLDSHPHLQIWMIGFGCSFLFYYSLKTLKSALFQDETTLAQTVEEPLSRRQIILFALGFSLLNPHAIIDTLVIVGSGSSQFPHHELIFMLGVISASFIWFCSLSLTTHHFSNILTQKKVWRAVEFSSSLIMAFIGVKLGLSGLL